MLRSEDAGVHYEAVGVLGNLVHSSQEIKQQVLQVGVSSAWLLLPGPQQLHFVLGWRSAVVRRYLGLHACWASVAVDNAWQSVQDSICRQHTG